MYYKQTPISEKPQRNGPHIFYYEYKGIEPWFRIRIWYNGKVEKHHEKEPDPTHWLKPITGVVMTEEEFERLYDGIVQNIETSVKRSDMPTWEQVLEMIKRDQIH